MPEREDPVSYRSRHNRVKASPIGYRYMGIPHLTNHDNLEIYTEFIFCKIVQAVNVLPKWMAADERRLNGGI